MGVNKYSEYVVILPEDDANRQIINGFLNVIGVNLNAIDVRAVAGGWKKALSLRIKPLIKELENNKNMSLLVVIDFDLQFEKRLKIFKEKLGNNLIDRAFLLGAISEPEKLKKEFNLPYEKIGRALAKSCLTNNFSIWENDLLKHNLPEIKRITSQIRSTLFETF